mgnify:CR=1 FL=1
MTTSSCFDTVKEQSVSEYGACTGSSSVIKGPGVRVTLTEDSTFANASQSCALVKLAVVDRSWVTATTSKASVSFQFQEKRDTTFVRNQHGASVGQVLGNGAAISVRVSDLLKDLDVCISLEVDRDNASFPVLGFGVANKGLTRITPIYADNIDIDMVLEFPFLCGLVSYRSLPIYQREDGFFEAILFPIETVPNPSKYNPDYLDHRAEVLVYVLAAVFIVDLLFLILFLFNMTRELRVTGNSIPVVAYIAFIFTILCIFRICYMFIYAAGDFDDNPLAEFVVFEIPTFLLFTTVVLSLGFWQKLVKQKTFFATSSNLLVLTVGLGIFLVWTLFAVITIVYSEVVLQKKSSSPCPGRVAPSTKDLDDSTRTLFVVYQVRSKIKKACHFRNYV